MVHLGRHQASERIQERLEALKGIVGTPGAARARQFAEAVEAIQSALDEVEAVEAELTRQNEELVGAREALEVERYRYKDLFDRAPKGYVVTDAAGTIQEINEAGAGLLNASPSSVRGKPLAVYVPWQRRSDFRALVRGLASRGTAELETTFQPVGCRPRTVLINVSHDEARPGHPARLLWSLRDITERLRAEAALRETEERLRHSQRLEAIGRLAGGIAHSFNNLLAAISFHAGLLRDELPEGGHLRRHAREIQQAGERAASLARQLLAFGRKQVLQMRLLSLNEILSTLEPMLRRLVGEGVRIELALAPESCTVCADLGQIEQVVLNLVLNARDAMPDGGRLTLSSGLRELERAVNTEGSEELPPGRYVCLRIADTGTGIPSEVLPHVFEPFFTTKEPGKGTGLGLSTVHGIVRQSGGMISVESTPGQGTAFTILLPEETAAAGEDIAPLPGPEAQQQPLEVPRGSETVLLVEDEDNIREPAVEILASRGYQVIAAADAADALEKSKVHEGPIQLLLTDLIMPGMNGAQLADHLSHARPEMRVVFMSGYSEDAIPRQEKPQPGRSFLQKPFPPEVLLLTVRQILDEPTSNL